VPESVSSPLIDLDRVAPGAESNIPSLFSPSGVRYSDGAVKLVFGDLASNGFGLPFGITRTWTNLTSTANGFSGSGMLIDQLPHLRQDPNGTLTAVANGFNVRYFDYANGVYTARFFVQDTFTYDSANHQYVQTDSTGDVIKYNDFTVTPANKQGVFKSLTDPYGNSVAVTAWTADGKVQEIQRSNGSLIESYLFSYLASGPNAGLLSSVVLRRSSNGGANWMTVRQVQYTYYSGEAHGNVGDLKLVQVQDGSSLPNTLDTTYYRYYTPSDSGGYTHGLRYVFRPDSYARLVAAKGTNIDSIADTDAAPYADDYFEYDSSQRVTKHTVAGAGSSQGIPIGLGTYTYSYTTSTNSPGFNSWATKTVETLPDGNQNIVYTNAYGEIMLQVYYDLQSSGNKWMWFTKYGGTGQAILSANPSAVLGYNDSYADLLNNQGGSYQYLSNASGLITDLDYYATTTAAPSGVSATLAAGGTLTAGTTYDYVITAVSAGGESGASSEVSVTPTTGNQTASLSWSAVSGATSYNVYRSTAAGQENTLVGTTTTTNFSDTGLAGSPQLPPAPGYYQDTKLQNGQTGTPILQRAVQYFTRTAGATVHPVASTTVYRNTNGTGGESTSYAYTFVTGTPAIQSVTTTLPIIPTAENGPGTADTSTTYEDNYGRPAWTRDGDGFLGYTAYDQATGAVTKSITDVNTADTGDFTGLPSGWTTPTGGGLELITQNTVDALGRTTKGIDPNGNVTYTVYNDPNYEVSVYPGWNSSTGTPTGPTQVTRQDRPGSYTETLTMSAAPHLASAPAAPSLTQISGGTLQAATYYVKVTYIVNGGETAASAESSLAVSANNLLQVNSPATATGATAYNVYVATTSGGEVLQNGSTPIPLGTPWTEPAGGLVTGTAAAPQTGNVPDGKEAIGAIQSLSRSLTNLAGQVTATDAYFNLGGLTYATTPTLGTLNVNYYETSTAYDNRGRLYQTTSPTGTENVTGYDGLGRVASTWLGTTTTSLTEVSSDAYDTSTTPAAPALSQVSGGTLGAATYYVKVTYLVNGAESPSSPESSLSVAANNLLQVSSPASVAGATGYNVYVATTSGGEVLQNASPIALGTSWTEPATGLVSGVLAPLPNGVGDGNLTQQTQYPGGSAVPETTQDWYDWRDREMATKGGAQSDNYTVPAAPTLGQTGGGSLPATTYYVKVTYLLGGAETPASPENSLAVAANNLLQVSSPASVTGATGYNVYVATTSGQEVLQNASPIALGTAWTEPAGGLVSGVLPPFPAHRPILYYTLDNLGEQTMTQQFDGDTVTLSTSNGVPQPPAAGLLRAQGTSAFDEQGRDYQDQTFSVNQSTGAVSSNALTTNTYRDHRGDVIETVAPGSPVAKTAYDGAGRATIRYTTDGGSGTSWSAAGSVSGDVVLRQVETAYDLDGNSIFLTDRERFDNETATGALGDPNTTPKARVSYVAYYYDAAKRLTATVNVGTNAGVAYTRPATPPARSDTVLRTDTGYAGDSVQQVSLTGSPTGGTFTLTFNGQTTSAIAYNATAATVQSALQALSTIGSNNALVAPASGGGWAVRFAGTLGGAAQPALTGNGSGLTGGSSPSVAVAVTSEGGDAGRVQQTTDPRGLVSKTDYDWLGQAVRTVQNFVAFAPSNGSDKTVNSSYDGAGHPLTYSVALPGGTSQTTQYIYGVTTGSGSTINSNDLLATVLWPDPSTGQPSPSSAENFTYNALGQKLTYTDRNHTTHGYGYDVLARPVSDTITMLGSGVDGSVQRIDTAYNTGGQSYLYTSFSTPAGTTIVNQVQDVYNGLGQLTGEYQSHSGAVNTSSTPEVQYAYTEMAGGANNSRPTSITYPNGRVVSDNYATGVDNSISRLTSLWDSSGTLETESYLGLDTVVQRAHPLSNVNLTYVKQGAEGNGDAGDQYTGLDRFGRVVDQRWLYTPTGTATDRFQYGYDRDGNALWRNNVVNTAFGELYHASGASNGYDGLNQLTAFERGTLSSSGGNGILDTVAASHSQSYNTDGVGNFSSVVTDSNTQTRTTNQQNQVTAVNSTGLGYDGNGNTTLDDQGHTLVWNAWNLPVAVKQTGQNPTTLETYSYDALKRRIVENSGTARDLYYSNDWQVLEEDVGGAMQAQNVWSPVYVDALVERDAGGARLWVQQDADWNVTALVNSSGSVVERYVYDPYGAVTYLNANWGMLSGSAYSWNYLSQGSRLDSIMGGYDRRGRIESPTLMRWLNPDPIRFAAGDPNLYRDEANNPLNAVDPQGTDLIAVFSLSFPERLRQTSGVVFGHGALLIGPGIHGEYWYLSFGSGRSPFTTRDNLEEYKFANLTDAKEWVLHQGYEKFVRYETTPAEDRDAARAVIREFRNKAYRIGVRNCVEAASTGLHAVIRDIPVADDFETPVNYYKRRRIAGSSVARFVDGGDLEKLVVSR
jgi:RHS repeat-associated protein